MLGSFLEIGIGTDDIAGTYADYQSLGFTAVMPGDVRGDGYAVVSDGRCHLGLYAGDHDALTLTFVRPELEQYVRALRRRGLEIEFAHLGDQEFHELGFRDPDGHRITLVEARTFSPIVSDQIVSCACGQLLELSMAVRSIAAARAFWLGLGLEDVAEGNEPHPWCRLATTGLTLGLHETAPFEAGPCFAATQFDARLEFLSAKGFAIERRAPQQLRSRPAATIAIRGSAPLYIVADPGTAD